MIFGMCRFLVTEAQQRTRCDAPTLMAGDLRRRVHLFKYSYTGDAYTLTEVEPTHAGGPAEACVKS